MKRKRLATREVVDQVKATADVVRYVGSIEHKRYPSPAGSPKHRIDADECPRIPAERWPEITETLRAAVRCGQICDVLDRGNYPRYVWGVFDGQLYEARHLLSPEGGYKAYPVNDYDVPESLVQLLRTRPDV